MYKCGSYPPNNNRASIAITVSLGMRRNSYSLSPSTSNCDEEFLVYVVPNVFKLAVAYENFLRQF